MRKKHLKAALGAAEESILALGSSNTKLWREREDLKLENERLTALRLDVEARLDASRSVNRDLREQLNTAKRAFGEAFVKGVPEAPRGPSRPNRKKLSDREVKDIRQAYMGGMKQKDLADNYGVNPATISRTVRGIYH